MYDDEPLFLTLFLQDPRQGFEAKINGGESTSSTRQWLSQREDTGGVGFSVSNAVSYIVHVLS